MAGLKGSFATDSNETIRSSYTSIINGKTKQTKRKIQLNPGGFTEIIQINKREGKHILAEADLKKKKNKVWKRKIPVCNQSYIFFLLWYGIL